MRRHGIRALTGRRFWPCATDSHHELPVAPEPPEAGLLGRATRHALAGRHHLPANWRGLALPGRRPGSGDAQDRRLINARSYADRADGGRADESHPTGTTDCRDHLSLRYSEGQASPRQLTSGRVLSRAGRQHGGEAVHESNELLL